MMYKIVILILSLATILSISFGIFYYKKVSTQVDNIVSNDNNLSENINITQKEKVIYKTELPYFIKNDLENFGLNIENLNEEDWNRYILSLQKASYNLISQNSQLNRSLFHLAAITNDKFLLEYLLKIGVDINEKDDDGKTALMYIAENGDFDTFKYLVENNANFYDFTTNKKGVDSDLLSYALRNEDEFQKAQIVEFLYENGFKLNSVKYFNDAVMIKSNKPFLMELLENIDINAKANDTFNLFQMAIKYKQDNDVIRYFLDNNVDLTVKNNGYTILHNIATNKDISVDNVERIISNKDLDINERIDKLGYTPLMFAVINNNPKLVEVLLDNGAKIDILDNKGEDIFHKIDESKIMKSEDKKQIRDLIENYKNKAK
ncbi:hypothetical protein CRU92_04670 [Arcobacter sp. FW59]|nr:hypothetical protein CRU92_04670 [Arcobacter sp. FW59]